MAHPTHPVVTPLRRPVPVAPVQGALALEIEPDLAPPRPRALPEGGLLLVPSPRTPLAAPATPAPPAAPRPPTPGSLEEFVWRVVTVALDVVEGNRPPHQLTRWTTERVRRDVARRAHLVARAGGWEARGGRTRPGRFSPRVASLRVAPVDTLADDGGSADAPRAAEAAIRVRYGSRSRALAARFEVVEGHWRCCALDFS